MKIEMELSSEALTVTPENQFGYTWLRRDAPSGYPDGCSSPVTLVDAKSEPVIPGWATITKESHSRRVAAEAERDAAHAALDATERARVETKNLLEACRRERDAAVGTANAYLADLHQVSQENRELRAANERLDARRADLSKVEEEHAAATRKVAELVHENEELTAVNARQLQNNNALGRHGISLQAENSRLAENLSSANSNVVDLEKRLGKAVDTTTADGHVLAGLRSQLSDAQEMNANQVQIIKNLKGLMTPRMRPAKAVYVVDRLTTMVPGDEFTVTWPQESVAESDGC